MTTDQHLDRVEICRFRGLPELDLDRLGKFNILLGANDVGKTSVLEAIFLLTGFVNLQLPIRVQEWRSLSFDTFDDLKVLFNDLDPDRPIHLVGHSAGGVVRRSLNISAPRTEAEPGSRASGGSGNGSSRKHGSASQAADQSSSIIPAGPRVLQYDAMVERRKKKLSSYSGTLRVEDDRFHFQDLGKPSGDHTISARYVSPRPGYNAHAIGDLIVRKETARLVTFLTVINPRIRDVATSGNVAYLDIGLDHMVPLNVFGTGMVRAANILSHCMLGKERVLLLDELENGLHHAAVRPVLQALLALSRDQDMQVFATTHSVGVLESLLDLLNEAEFAEHRSTTHCFTLQRDSEGFARPYRYEYAQFEHCIRNGIEIR